MASIENTTAGAVAVYCGSSFGNHKAYYNAAVSLGQAIARDNRTLVYGGGSFGIMGVVSAAALNNGGKVTGVIPYAMIASGGERPKTASPFSDIPDTSPREKIETIVVNSMHERKVEMAARASGFVGLPGGFGTFEEVLEVTTWTQLGIHNKPVILLNIRGFFDPLRQLIKNGVSEGYIQPFNEHLIVFVDGPSSLDEHDTFNWGKAALDAITHWSLGPAKTLFDWTKTREGKVVDNLQSS